MAEQAFFTKEDDSYFIPGIEISLIEEFLDFNLVDEEQRIGLFEGNRQWDGARSQEICTWDEFDIYEGRETIPYKCCGNHRGSGHKDGCKNGGVF